MSPIRYRRLVTPSGMIMTYPLEDSLTFGTCVSPVRPIPFDRPKPPEELREEAAAKVLAVFRELGLHAEGLTP